jgi:protein-S-isoprenylcysteine O-methyltransferase Ste14
MQEDWAALTILLMLGMVWTRVLMMKKAGTKAVHFGQMDKKDFLIPPFAFFYFYVVFTPALHLPPVSRQAFFHSEAVAWIGAAFCLAGLSLLLLSLVSFGKSFRIGIDQGRPDKLVMTGVFAFTRNPIYVAFGLILVGQFLIQPNGILLLYLGGGFWLFHRQILREESFMKGFYGEEYLSYCRRVRRYF